MINHTITHPVKDEVCNGFLQEKGLACEPPEDVGKTTLRSGMSDSYIFLKADAQLVMLSIAVRVIALLQLQLRAVTGSVWELALRRLALFFAAVFFLLTIPATYNYDPLL